MEKKFFDYNDFFIDEKVQFLKFENEYKVFNNEGSQIGAVKQKLTGGQKLQRLFFNKAMLPFLMEIADNNGQPLVFVKRGWTFWTSKITLVNPSGQLYGFINQKFKLFKPTFNILNPAGQMVGQIVGDWKAWNFEIKDVSGNIIGTINKKWAGLAKEVFTTADKYMVHINPEYTHEMNKIIILSTAITIDMVLKESK
jgi:uncharacterized protein YxjI